tara:strand:+ start:7043 stop:7816 length:774 start_codon:yes stop_codon:yes gene_type:complete
MDKARILREILISGKSLTTKEIVNIIKNDYPNEWAEKQQYYLNGGYDDDYVYVQVRAEVGSALSGTRSGWIKLGWVSRQKNEDDVWTYTVTPEYQEFLKNNNNSKFLIDTDESEDDVIDTEKNNIDNDECEECPKEYFVYLMKSDEFDNTYKIGYTDDLVRRPKELRSPSNKVYNIFNFYVQYWVKLNSKLEMEMMEDTLHRYFHRVRKHPRNGNVVDTEIFAHPNMESMFTNFIVRNYIKDEYQKDVVVEYNLKNK